MRTTVIAVGLFLLLSWPLVTLGERPGLLLGMPAILVHILSTWTIAILLYAMVQHRHRKRVRKTEEERG